MVPISRPYEAADHDEQRLAEHVRRVVDTFPELTAEQRERLRVLLRPQVPHEDGGEAA